jgi:MGT family glycosyltransferase
MGQRSERPLELLFATLSGGGNVPPVLTVAQKMVARGHRVRIMSDACDREDCEALGLAFVSWTRAPNRLTRLKDDDPLRDWEATNPAESIACVIDGVFAGPSLAYATDLREELARAPADLVISSDMLMGVLVACEALDQPVVVMSTNLCIFPVAGAPTVNGGLGPARTAEEREAHAHAQAGMMQLLDTGLPALNAARDALGLKPLAHLMDQVETAQAHLMAISAAFDFPWENQPDKYRHIGPQIDELPGAAWTSPWPKDDPRPLVLVGFSTTFQDQAGALQRVLDGLGSLPVRVLLTTGETIDPDELRAPGNAFVIRKAAHGAVMREAGVVVTHGGHGTVIRAMAAGLPTLVVPHGRDQHDNAARVTARDAGLELPAQASAEEFAEAVRRLLAEPQFRTAAQAMSHGVRADIEGSPIVELLEAAARVPALA